MKYFIACLLGIGCCMACKHREADNTRPVIDPVTGRAYTSVVGYWLETAQYMSDGSPGKWYPVANGRRFVVKEDSTLVSSPADIFHTGNRLYFKDSITLVMKDETGKDISFRGNYQLTDSCNTLDISFAPCTEGCATRFKRQQFN